MRTPSPEDRISGDSREREVLGGVESGCKEVCSKGQVI